MSNNLSLSRLHKKLPRGQEYIYISEKHGSLALSTPLHTSSVKMARPNCKFSRQIAGIPS